MSPLKSKALITILSLTLLFRVGYSIYRISTEKIDTYEYGAIAQNIIEGKGYTLFYNDNGNLGFVYKADAKTYKSAWMPPLYVYFLVPFYLFDSEIIRLFMVFLSQSIISLGASIFIYRLTKKYFNLLTALIATGIYGFMPEFIFAASTIGPTIIFHFLIVLLIYYLSELTQKSRTKQLIFIGVVSGILLLLRSEILLFIFLIIIFLIIRKKIREVILISSLIIIILLPWQIRNFLTFDRVVLVTTNAGFNLYRGHNPFQLGDWRDKYTQEKVKKLIKYDDYEVKVNEMYLEESIRFIKEQPLKVITNSFIKIFQLWIFDPKGKLNLHPFYLIPWLFILILALKGIVKTFDWNKFGTIYFYLISTTTIAILFFVIPRYQTMFKIILLPFAADSIYYYLNKYKFLFNRISKD